MQENSDTNQSQPIAELEHDHEDLTALLRDLSELTERATSASDQARMLAEARDLLRYFRSDMEAHFRREESDLFPVLRAELPARHEALEGLARAHGAFAKLVADIESALGSPDDPVKALRSSRATIAELNAHFVKHSVAECDLLAELNDTVKDPARRAELRERLRGY